MTVWGKIVTASAEVEQSEQSKKWHAYAHRSLIKKEQVCPQIIVISKQLKYEVSQWDRN